MRTNGALFLWIVSSCVGVTAQPLIAQEEPIGSKEDALIQSLNQASLQSAFQMLRQRYLEKDALSLDLLNRLALQSLLDHLGGGAELVPEANKIADVHTDRELRMVSELISEDIAYVRPFRLNGSELKAFDSLLNGFQTSTAKALILDLRCPGGSQEIGNVLDFASRFVDSGTELFSLGQPGDLDRQQVFKTRRGKIWTRRIVVLVDRDTSPTGELMAACMRASLGSIVIGSATKGRTAEYEEVPIGKGGVLRYAVAEAVVTEGVRLFGVGVRPDVESSLARQLKLKMFLVAQRDGVQSCIEESQRPRLNEAALVSGTNPELGESLKVRDEDSTNVGYDTVIQTAVDVISAALRIDL